MESDCKTKLFENIKKPVDFAPASGWDENDLHKFLEKQIHLYETELARKQDLFQGVSEQLDTALEERDGLWVELEELRQEKKSAGQIYHGHSKVSDDDEETFTAENKEDEIMDEETELTEMMREVTVSFSDSPTENPDIEIENLELDYLSDSEEPEARESEERSARESSERSTRETAADSSEDSTENSSGESTGRVSGDSATRREQELTAEVKRLTNANSKHWAKTSKMKEDLIKQQDRAKESAKRELDQKLNLVRAATSGLHDLRPEIDNASFDILKTFKVAGPVAIMNLKKPVNAVAFLDEFDEVPERRHEISLNTMLASLTVVEKIEDAPDEMICSLLAFFHAEIHKVKLSDTLTQHSALYHYMIALANMKLTGLAAAMQMIAVANITQREMQPQHRFFRLYNDKLRSSAARIHPYNSWSVLEKIAFTWLHAVYKVSPDWLAEFPQNLYAEFMENVIGCNDFIDVLLLCQDFIDKEPDAKMLILQEDKSKIMVIINCTDTKSVGSQYIWIRHNNRVWFSDSDAQPLLKIIDGSLMRWEVQATWRAKVMPWFTVDMDSLEYFTTHYKAAFQEACKLPGKTLELEIAALNRGEYFGICRF